MEKEGRKEMKLYDELKWRGLINDVTSPELEEKLNQGGINLLYRHRSDCR